MSQHNYSKSEYQVNVHGSISDIYWNNTFTLISYSRYCLLKQYIDTSCSTLEIGAGPGWNTHYFKFLHLDIVEPSKLYSKYYAEHKIKHYTSIEECQDSYSQILLSHVLEHVENPLHFLVNIQSKMILNSGDNTSKLIILLPDESSGLFYKESRKIDQHLYSFNRITISNLVEYAGYNLDSIHILPYGYEHFLARNLFSKLPMRRITLMLYLYSLRLLQAFVRKKQFLVICSNK